MIHKTFICTHEDYPAYIPPEGSIIVTPNDDPIFRKTGYRHLRHIYFIWQHLDMFKNPDVITIFQHRRYLYDYILPYGIDCIAPYWPYRCLGSVYKQYSICHDKNDIDALKLVVDDDRFDTFLATSVYGHCFHNMFTMKRSLFDEYCSFLFGNLFELESILGEPENERYAFLGERLGAYFIWKTDISKTWKTKVIEV